MAYLTNIFTDSLVNPQHLDYSDLDWSYPLTTRDLSTVPVGKGHLITNNVYKSKMIAVGSYIDSYALNYLDLTIYCHGVASAIDGSVRVLCWKSSYTIASTETPGAVNLVLVNNVGLADCMASASNGQSSSVHTLHVADYFDSVQLVIANACTGVSVYIRDPAVAYSVAGDSFITTAGVVL